MGPGPGPLIFVWGPVTRDPGRDPLSFVVGPGTP